MNNFIIEFIIKTIHASYNQYMILTISDTKTIKDIQQEFCTYFPFLKIEFYDVPHAIEEASSYKHQYTNNKTIAAIRKKHNIGELEIYPWDKTGAIEQAFKQKYGLYVQIFRLIGGEWIQTAGTDMLTLGEQNEIGRKTTEELLSGKDGWIEKEKLI